VPEKTVKTIRIKWVRSGIGFTRRQKMIVRSLGLNKLNQTVVRPDTPQIRGIVAAVPHLLEIVPKAPAPPWAAIPEYTVHAPRVAPAEPSESTAEGATDAVGKADIAVESAEESTISGDAEASETHSPRTGEKQGSLPEGNEPA
jgi:large subunit ribosomal protein L30